MGGITSLFSIFHLPLTDCPSALVGGTDPSLPWHLDQRQTTKLKCHFNFLPALVTAGRALSPGYSCKFHIMWCQKGYSPSISHSDLIHLSPLSVIPVVRWVRVLLKGCQRQMITLLPLTDTKKKNSDKLVPLRETHTHIHTHHHQTTGGKVTNFKEALHLLPLSPFALLLPLSSPISILLPHLSSREKFIHGEERNHLQVWT